MKKFLSALFALAAFSTLAVAKDRVTTVQEVTESNDEFGKVITTTTYDVHSVFLNRAQDNWSIDFGIGAHMYMGENDKYLNFGDWISFPALSISATKWLTPSFGFRLGLDFAKMKGLWQWYHPELDTEDWGTALYRGWSETPYKTMDDPHGRWFYPQSTWTYNAFLVAIVDLNNLIAGYKPGRIWHSSLYAGGGVMGSFGYRFPEELPDHLKTGATTYVSPSFNAGWLNTFRLTKNLDINLDIRGKIISDEFDGEFGDEEPDYAHLSTNVPFDGGLGVFVGLSWRFTAEGDNFRSWKEVRSVNTVHTFDKVTAANAQALAQYRERLESERERNRALAAASTATGKLEIPDAWLHINFVIGKADISEDEMAKIAGVAEFIKATPDTKYRVTGYCDVQTATPAFNKKLSKRRSDAVCKALTETFGIPADRLINDYKGGVDTMFLDDPQFSRCVMITPEK